jgi:hypothetical protein
MMNDNEEYFDASVFESTKSYYACRYRNKLEFELMKRLDAEPKIRTYYQPLLNALVRNSKNEKFISIDFWIEYHSGKIDLLYIEKDYVISDQAKIIVLSNTPELLKAHRVGFTVLNPKASRLRRIAPDNLNLNGTAAISDFCFVNFGWVN